MLSYAFRGVGVHHPALEGDRADTVEWTFSGRMEPSESGEYDFAGAGEFRGTFWEASRFTNHGIEYCKSMAVDGRMNVYGFVDGQQLYVLGIRGDDEVAAGLGWLGFEGSVPLRGGTVAEEQKAAVRNHPLMSRLPCIRALVWLT